MSALLLSGLMLALASPAPAATLHFKTEVYPPFGYRDGKEYRGASIEQLQNMMASVPAEYTLEIMPWARAYAQALNEPMNCVLTTAHTPERDKLFKWVEPLLIDRILLVARKGSAVSFSSLDEAKNLAVGTQRNDYTYTLLQQMDFKKIDIAADIEVTLGKLLGKRIALMPLSEKTYQKLTREGVDIEVKGVLTEQRFSIACNLDVPDPLIADMQAALDELIASGGQAEIFRKYGLEPKL